MPLLISGYVNYPQELKASIKFYTKEITLEILNKTKELQQWIKKQ